MPGFHLKLPWQQARFFPISRFPFRVGRSVQGDLEIPDPCVSRRHFVLHNQSGATMLFDQKSMGGTQLNGARVNESPLKDGDVVHIGETILQYSEGDRPGKPHPLLQQEHVLCLEERGTIDFFYSLSGERTFLVNVADRMDIRTGLGYDSQDLHQLQVHNDGSIECHRLPFELLLSASVDAPQALEPGTACQFGSVSVHVLAIEPFPYGPSAIQRLIRRQKFLELLERKSLERVEERLRATPPGPERSRVLKNTLSTWLSSIFSNKNTAAPAPDEPPLPFRQTHLNLSVSREDEQEAETWKAVLKTLIGRNTGTLTGALEFFERDPVAQRQVLEQLAQFLGRHLAEVETELHRRSRRQPQS